MNVINLYCDIHGQEKTKGRGFGSLKLDDYRELRGLNI
jgi:hypothetical protein